MADLLVLISAFVLVFVFLLLGIFISRLGVLERQALMGAPVRSVSEIPSESLVGVRNPFIVKLTEDRTWQDGMFHFILSSTVPCYMTLYWGVPVSAINKSVWSERPSTNHDDDDNSDDDNSDDDDDSSDDMHKECEAVQFVPIHRILSGSYESKSPSEYYEPGQEHQITAQIPTEFAANFEQHQQDTELFQLVVVMEWSRNIGQQANTNSIKPCDIVSLLTAFRCNEGTSGRNKFSIAAQYIQIANGRIFPLKKLYVSTDDQDTTDSGSQTNSTCVVCHSMPISRVLLPCRHACVCGSCFTKLEFKCPMCRQLIQSYFLTQEEPEMSGNELDTSRELHRMSLLDILRGVYNSG